MILNKEYIKGNITNNKEINQSGERVLSPVPFRFSHGATDLHLGDGLIVYSLIQFYRSKICVCLGSGGGFIPRIMTEARRDLWRTEIFEGDNDDNWGDIGSTYIVDAMNGVGGNVDWSDETSFFRSRFFPRVIKDTTHNAFHNFFVLNDTKIDYLHIDAGHLYENVKEDFELYSTILSETGIISIHDTDETYLNNYIVTEDVKKGFDDWSGVSKFVKEIDRDKWEVLNLFNFGIIKTKPASTGLTLIRKR